MADPVARLADQLSDIAGAPVELERPADAEHGDYATNVALRLAASRKQAPAKSPRRSPTRPSHAASPSVPRPQGPAS